MSERFLQGVIAAFPIIVSYIFIGFASGALGASLGLSILEVAILSLILFAGSAQFVFALLYTGSLWVLIPTIFLLNFRHFLYAMSFLPMVKKLSMPKKIIIGMQLTDESFSLASVLKNKPFEKMRWMFGLNFSSYTAWFFGNTMGAYWSTSDFIGKFTGLNFALAAMFAGILILQWTAAKNPLAVSMVAISSALIMIILELLISNPLNLLIAIFCSCSIGLLITKKEKI